MTILQPFSNVREASSQQGVLGAPIQDVPNIVPERVSEDIEIRPGVASVTLHIYSGDAGDLAADLKMSDGNYRQISTTAVLADTLLSVPVAFFPGQLRIRWLAAAQTGNVIIDISQNTFGGAA